MNPTLIGAFLRQRLASPLRLTLLAVLVGIPQLLTFANRMATLDDSHAMFLSLIVAAGLIGQDISSGTLQLLFARPVARWSYVVSRWIAATLGVTALVVMQLVLTGLAMLLHGNPPSLHDATVFLADGVLVAAGSVAVLTLASSLVTGIGDLGLLLAAWIVAQTLPQVGMARGWAWMVSLGQELQHLIAPRLDVNAIAAGTLSWHDATSYLSSVVVCLALAMLVMNRRELSYANANA